MNYQARIYIGWLNPEGEFTMVESYDHEEFADEKIKELNLNPERLINKFGCKIPSGDLLCELGWCRTVFNSVFNKLDVFLPERPTDALMSGLFDLYMKASQAGHEPETEVLRDAWQSFDFFVTEIQRPV